MKLRRLFLSRTRRACLANLDLAIASLPAAVTDGGTHSDPSGTSVPVGDADGRVTADGPSVGRPRGDSECTHLPDSPCRQRPRPEPHGSLDSPVRVIDLTVDADVAPSP